MCRAEAMGSGKEVGRAKVDEMCKDFNEGAGDKHEILCRLMWVFWRMDKTPALLINLHWK